MRRPLAVATAASAALVAATTARLPLPPHHAPPAERCVPPAAGDTATPAGLLARARAVTGYDRFGDRVLRYAAVDTKQDYIQSDRTYPPYHTVAAARDAWLDPRTGVERVSEHLTGAANGPGRDATTLATETAVWATRDTLTRPFPALYQSAYETRPLNPWAVLHDWSAAADVRAAGRCLQRDQWRTVLARRGPLGEERLYLARDGFPVKLDRLEPHYLWGRQRVEYQYVTWYDAGPFPAPMGAARITDGEIQAERSLGRVALVPRDSAPPLAAPDPALRMEPETPTFLRPDAPDTVRVAPDLFLLRNRGYTEAVALARDTLFVLDATQGEARARHDSAWAARLFPGRHPAVLVVTDLAWPHVAGVRFWVASGARVVSHRMSRDFLQRVVDRRWAQAPDAYERVRAARPLRLTAVDSGTRSLAGGAVQVAPIDGVGSEGALLVYFPAQRFLWAGDYVQSLTAPSLYVSEVVAAARRAGFRPESVAAQHAPVTPWSKLEELAAQRP
jgi:hypothetical protein